MIFHTGDPQGGSAYVSFMPDDGLGVVVLTNQHCTDNLIATNGLTRWRPTIYDHLLNQKLTGQLELSKCGPTEI